jgi:uncharacterized damage-inducible protein DinB
MTQQLQKLYNKIELQRSQLLQSLQTLPGEKLNYHTPGKWSINQIIAHLITAENLSIQYLNKKILGASETMDSGFVEELKMVLLVISQRMPLLKFKAPKFVVERTSKETEIKKLADDWDRSRAELKNILDHLPDQYLKRKIYKHVRVGMLNIQHALKFFREHVGHHTPQIKYLLKQK